jgi:GT2 family glycosyltransferase
MESQDLDKKNNQDYKEWPQVAIIILNYNGWKDTIECLESLRKSTYNNYWLVVIDNGSTDDSCERIIEWANKKYSNSIEIKDYVDKNHIYCVIYNKNTAESGGIKEKEQTLSSIPATKRLILINNEENLGFAGGCNVGIRYAMRISSKYVFLLNNDTVVDNHAVEKMVAFLENNSDYEGVTGQIRYYHEPAKVWNCGGKLMFYGGRRYYYSGSNISKVPQTSFKTITFLTGCAVLFRIRLFEKIGLLSERFFFGEEDFDLCLRMKDNGFKLACANEAIIYHKVGSSIENISSNKTITRIYLHYLNRFINMKSRWPKFQWRIWRFFYFMYICPMLWVRHRITWKELWILRRMLINNSNKLDQVDKNTFEQAMNVNNLDKNKLV